MMWMIRTGLSAGAVERARGRRGGVRPNSNQQDNFIDWLSSQNELIGDETLVWLHINIIK